VEHFTLLPDLRVAFSPEKNCRHCRIRPGTWGARTAARSAACSRVPAVGRAPRPAGSMVGLGDRAGL